MSASPQNVAVKDNSELFTTEFSLEIEVFKS